MIKIDVFIQNKNWKKHISNPKKYLTNKIKTIGPLIKLIKNKNVNLSIMLAGNKEIKDLNYKFRKKNKITDVLSFPNNNINEIKNKKKLYLGDIILNFYKINKKNFNDDFDKLWVHGLLHLLGYKHYYDKDFKKMSSLERRLLKYIRKK
tara:strand:+ start:333 stop:779 length:447 start_codon:yes stop_codon:yes gene_type:complete